MLKWLANLPVRKRVGLLGILLGILAIFGSDPYETNIVNVNLKDIIYNKVDRVKPLQLADWIIKGNYDFTLVDLRNREEFNKYNIPTSECVLLPSLLDATDFSRTDKIILYADDDFKAAKGWLVLTAKNFKYVSVLDGGIKAWRNEVLYPKIPEKIKPEEKSKYEKIKQISKYFGGTPQTGGKTEPVVHQLVPKLKIPVGVSFKKHKKKAAREGC